MRHVLAFLTAILFTSTSALCQQITSDDWFKVCTLSSGEEQIITPFAEVPLYSSYIDEDHPGKFTQASWSPDSSAFLIKTSAGENGIFKKENEGWVFENTAPSNTNGRSYYYEKCTYVGQEVAKEIAFSLNFREKTYMLLRANRIIISQQYFPDIIPDDESWEQNYIREPLTLPRDLYCKTILGGKILMIWSSSGKTLKINKRRQGKFLLIHPSINKSLSWLYSIGGVMSGFNISLNEFLKSIEYVD
jgi:hypothetical protein